MIGGQNGLLWQAKLPAFKGLLPGDRCCLVHLSPFFFANDYIGLYKKITVEKLRRLFCLGRRRRVSILRRWVLKDLHRQSCVGTPLMNA